MKVEPLISKSLKRHLKTIKLVAVRRRLSKSLASLIKTEMVPLTLRSLWMPYQDHSLSTELIQSSRLSKNLMIMETVYLKLMKSSLSLTQADTLMLRMAQRLRRSADMSSLICSLLITMCLKALNQIRVSVLRSSFNTINSYHQLLTTITSLRSSLLVSGTWIWQILNQEL